MSIKAKPSKHRFHNSSNDVIHDHGLKQFVMEPTRLESGSLPDEQPTSDPQRQIPLYLKEEQEEEQYSDIPSPNYKIMYTHQMNLI